MSENEVRKILTSLTSLFTKVAKNQISNCVKRVSATVISADNAIHYATVTIHDDKAPNAQSMELMNCSGRDLKTGDTVMLEYTSDLTDAFIAYKNDGKPWGW